MTFERRMEGCLRWVDAIIARPATVVAATLLVVAWAVSGPALHFSKTWQLLINTPTMVITYLIVFTLQNARNAAQKAMHVKIDEMLLALGHGDSADIAIEDRPQGEIDRHRRSRKQEAQ